jgi:undecaprenyl-diphosphatase
MVLTIIVAVALADQAASSFFKPYFSRYRPCHEVELQPLVHVVRGCGGQYGFVSAHAATTFSFAMIMWLLVRQTFRYIYFLFAWAAIVSYSRIYVGVHYPLDLFFGALVGIACAMICYVLYKSIERRQANKNTRSPVS